MNALLSTANYWQQAGISVIPIKYMGKTPDARLLPPNTEYQKTWEPYQRRLPTIDELNRWFAGSLHNLAVVTGWQNLVVLDFDDMLTYLKWTLWATRTGGVAKQVLRLAYKVQTARGVHVYIRTSQPEQNRKLPGLDIKARGGYVLAPPSVHPSGALYRVLQPGVPMVVEALSDVLPASLLMATAPVAAGPVVSGAGSVPAVDPWTVAERGPDPDRDLVSQVRAKYRVEDFVPGAERSSGDGRWMMARCPFHDDRHPSFWLDTTRQIFGCYSGCTPRPLDVINLFGRLHGLSNRDAILWLAFH